MRSPRFVIMLFLLSGATGCTSRTPRNAFVLSAQSLERRQMSSRRFEAGQEKQLLVGCANLLQDLGFTIDDSETQLGLIVGSKDRSAVEGGQVAGKVLLAMIGKHMSIDRNQKLRASIVTRPIRGGVIVRATFQRIVWDEDGRISKRERLDDPKMYQAFFDQLSKAVFLDAHNL